MPTISRFAGLLCLLIAAPAWGQTPAQQAVLRFDQPMEEATRTSQPSQEVWKYDVSDPNNIRRSIRDPKEVALHIIPAPRNRATSCRIASSGNYVGLGRLLDPAYKHARRLTWKWAVMKHPHGGKLAGFPNDQAIKLYVCFRAAKGADDYEYTILCFCWTAKTTSKRDRIPGSLPWKGAPEAIIQYLALRNGPSDEEFSEDVDLQLEYEKAFSKPAPEVWAIGIGADSNDVGPNANGMTTDAVISDIRITN